PPRDGGRQAGARLLFAGGRQARGVGIIFQQFISECVVLRCVPGHRSLLRLVSENNQSHSELYTPVFANGAGFYGDALHHPAIAVHNSFPEKSTSGGMNSIDNPLKRRNRLSRAFPKMLLLGRVRCSSRSFPVAFLPYVF